MANVEHPWAYVNATGSDHVSACQERIARIPHGGKPLGKTYWSPHRSGARLPMDHVVLKSGTTFFKYRNKADESKGGPGESLSHLLFKKAIARLTETELRLGDLGRHKVSVEHGEIEKKIERDGNAYFADAYLRFTSPTDLAMRWAGEVYVEVYHQHFVPAEKEKRLRELELPVVEVKLPDFAKYQYEDESTKDREEKHIAWVCSTLQKAGNFLAGTVISDRRSKPYLEVLVQGLEQKLLTANADLRAEREHARKLLDKAEQEAAGLRVANTAQQERADQLATSSQTIRGELKELRNFVHALKLQLMSAKVDAARANELTAKSVAELAAYRKKQRRWLVIESVIGVAAALVLISGWLVSCASSRAQAQAVSSSASSKPLISSAETGTAFKTPRSKVHRIAGRLSVPAGPTK
ncbi:hypothetical protein AWB71_00004 [Caballeronia peredens]|nr:hypothetical protein AWB71_00004 [Caballeronia peredens]